MHSTCAGQPHRKRSGNRPNPSTVLPCTQTQYPLTFCRRSFLVSWRYCPKPTYPRAAPASKNYVCFLCASSDSMRAASIKLAAAIPLSVTFLFLFTGKALLLRSMFAQHTRRRPVLTVALN
eukprot:893185-Prymnesium_polylepis.1